MKNKKFLATLLAASMLMGSSLTVFADDVAITGNTTQEVPMSMTVTAEDLESAGNLTDVTVRIPARMTLAYKNGSYISTDKVGAFGTLPSYKKVIISNENSDILFKNTDESKTVTGKLTLGMLNEDLVVSSAELAAGKADANDIKYSQVTAKVNTKNLENADTFSGNANLKVKIEALRDTTGLESMNIKDYKLSGDSYSIYFKNKCNTPCSLMEINVFNNASSAVTCYDTENLSVENYNTKIEEIRESSSDNLYLYYKPNIKVLELKSTLGQSEKNIVIKTALNNYATTTDWNTTYNTYLENNLYPNTLANDFLSPFRATPNLELLILPNDFYVDLFHNFNSKLYGLGFVKDYDAENNLFVYIPNISFNGTMEEWNAKAEWKFPKMANTVTVYCTDGTITYE